MMCACRRTHPEFFANLSDRRRLLMSVEVLPDVIQHSSLSGRYRHSANPFPSKLVEYYRIFTNECPYLYLKIPRNFWQKHSLTDTLHNVRIHSVTVLATVARSVRPRFACLSVSPTDLFGLFTKVETKLGCQQNSAKFSSARI